MKFLSFTHKKIFSCILCVFSLSSSYVLAQAPSITRIKHPKELCYIKKFVRSMYYQYKPPFFLSQPESTANLIIIKTPGFFYQEGLFNLVGMEAKLDPLSSDKSLIYWYRYDKMKEGMDLNKVCRPDLNQGKCLFKTVYEGDLAVQYNIPSSSFVFSYNEAKVSIHSNKERLVFPHHCQ